MLFVAAIAGQFVQNGSRFFGASEAPTQAASVLQAPAAVFNIKDVTALAASNDNTGAAADAIIVPVAPDATFDRSGFSTRTRALAARVATLNQAPATPVTVGRDLNPFGMPCNTSFTATAAPGAMVDLALSANCHINERVELSQDRLRFARSTSNTGTLSVAVPALSGTPHFIVRFSNGDILTASVKSPDAQDYDRIMLQWQGDNAMHIHAYEFGARYGDDGHVWAGHPRDASFGDTAKGGFLTTLGDPDLANPLRAEVYSYPRGESRNSGVVRINIETGITKTNCGHEITAETLQSGATGTLLPADLTMSVPGCDAVGEFLVLKNIFRDMKIARN